MKSQVDNLIRLVKKKKESSEFKGILSFVSGKGGVGKTTISLSVAYILANSFNKKVLLLDCDLGLGNIHVLLGLSPEKNLKSVLRGKSLEDVIQRKYSFDVILGFSGLESLDELDSYEASNLILQLERIVEEYDYVIIDNSAGISRFTLNLCRASSETFIITTPEPTALTDAYAFVKTMDRMFGYRQFKVLVNMAANKKEGLRVFERFSSSVRKFLNFDLKLASIIPYSSRVKASVMKGSFIVKDYPSDSFSLELKKMLQSNVSGLPLAEKKGFIEKFINFLREGI